MHVTLKPSHLCSGSNTLSFPYTHTHTHTHTDRSWFDPSGTRGWLNRGRGRVSNRGEREIGRSVFVADMRPQEFFFKDKLGEGGRFYKETPTRITG